MPTEETAVHVHHDPDRLRTARWPTAGPITESSRIVKRYSTAPLALLDGAAQVPRANNDAAVLAEPIGALATWIDDLDILACGSEWAPYAHAALGNDTFQALNAKGARGAAVEIVDHQLGSLPDAN